MRRAHHRRRRQRRRRRDAAPKPKACTTHSGRLRLSSDQSAHIRDARRGTYSSYSQPTPQPLAGDLRVQLGIMDCPAPDGGYASGWAVPSGQLLRTIPTDNDPDRQRNPDLMNLSDVILLAHEIERRWDRRVREPYVGRHDAGVAALGCALAEPGAPTVEPGHQVGVSYDALLQAHRIHRSAGSFPQHLPTSSTACVHIPQSIQA
jgi:hypothetical protein